RGGGYRPPALLGCWVLGAGRGSYSPGIRLTTERMEQTMKRLRTFLGASLLALLLPGNPLRAHVSETATVESAAEVLHALCTISPRCIPPALMQDAQGVAIFPNVLKAGLGLGGRFGRGVILIRQADGGWSNPLFLTLVGGGIGWQVGIQST